MAVVLTPGAQAADPAGAGRVVDPILLEVVNQRLQSITDEMETVLCRSAFSSLIKEALDASAGLYDKHGDTLAQAAIVAAVRLDAQEAPQREIDKDKLREQDERLALEKARLLNKPNFRP